jgi:hypothetical protein
MTSASKVSNKYNVPLRYSVCTNKMNLHLKTKKDRLSIPKKVIIVKRKPQKYFRTDRWAFYSFYKIIIDNLPHLLFMQVDQVFP